MNIENIQYLFTLEGGGWGYSHRLYIITKDDKIYTTEKYSDSDLLDCNPDYVCDLYPENLENCCISTSYSWDKDGNSIKKNKYLFELLNSDGKVDFEAFKEQKYAVMDAEELTLYKNEDNTLKMILKQDYSGDNTPAVQYVIVICGEHARDLVKLKKR